MGKLIKVAAQSRTHNINFVVQGGSGSATYDLAQVYKENQYMPERKAPESNIVTIYRDWETTPHTPNTPHTTHQTHHTHQTHQTHHTHRIVTGKQIGRAHV